MLLARRNPLYRLPIGSSAQHCTENTLVNFSYSIFRLCLDSSLFNLNPLNVVSTEATSQMSQRRLALSNKKVRNIPRRLRALAAWAADFDGYFPAVLSEEEKYCNWKIPIHMSMVEGKQATADLKRQCAQALINAAQHLRMSRPEHKVDCRVVAVICLPDMFSSEICIYTDLNYHRSHIPPADSEYVETARSLAEEWALVLPPGMGERGLRYTVEDCNGETYEEERWYFGEVD